MMCFPWKGTSFVGNSGHPHLWQRCASVEPALGQQHHLWRGRRRFPQRGGGDDYLDGGSGNDTLLAGGGNDLLLGGVGDDSLIGGGYGNATMDGGDGNDYLVAGASGNQVMIGGAGNDTFSGFTNNSVKIIEGDGGIDRVIIPDAYNPADLSMVPGTEPESRRAPTTPATSPVAGYKLYFTNFTGTLQFTDTDVPLSVVCFLEGTAIMTDKGERPIESLRSGDMVVTVSGQGAHLKPVLWVGRREVDLETHPRAEDVAPILVMPGALGENMPLRPLRVSPDHALLVDGALVPAKLLVDGEMIRHLPARGRVTYFHVELEVHDILLAEGAPSESYIDLGNRAAFDNAGVVQMLHADFAAKREGGMKRVTEGPALDKARLAIARNHAADGKVRRALA